MGLMSFKKIWSIIIYNFWVYHRVKGGNMCSGKYSTSNIMVHIDNYENKAAQQKTDQEVSQPITDTEALTQFPPFP